MKSKTFTFWAWKILLLVGLVVSGASAETITVDPNGSADFNNIQDAVFHAWDGDIVVVQQGIYQENILFTGCPIMVMSTDPNDPNVVEVTVITCDSGNAVTIDFGEGNDTVLQGFTIIGGTTGVYCMGTSPTIKNNIIRECVGQAIAGSNGAAPVISNNIIVNNNRGVKECDGPITDNIISGNESLNNYGGGLVECNGTIRTNIISDNMIASTWNDVYGGGLYACNGDIIDNVIYNNSVIFSNPDRHSNAYGGGLYQCNGTIRGNIISSNTVTNFGQFDPDAFGGGLADCTGAVEGNIISGNTATGDTYKAYGGGLYGCDGEIVGNTIVGNKAVRTDGNLGSGGGIYYLLEGGEVKNNIIAYNSSGISGDCNNTYNFYYMNLGGDLGGGAMPGIGERRLNPDFAVAGYWDDPCGTPDALNDDVWVDGDYHLKSEADRWDPNSQTWVFDDITSRCIDAGDPTSDWSAELWPHGQRINIGAYGGTPEASMSLSEAGNIADLDNNGDVDYIDLMMFIDKWLSREVLLPEDLDRNGFVNFADFAVFAENY